MTVERANFSDLLAKRRTLAEVNARPVAEQAARAAVSMQNVTGDPDWDRFLTYIQATIEDANKAKAGHESAVMDPRLTNADAIMVHKVQALLMGERIRVLEAVLAIPADLKREGDKAMGLLRRLADEEPPRAA